MSRKWSQSLVQYLSPVVFKQRSKNWKTKYVYFPEEMHIWAFFKIENLHWVCCKPNASCLNRDKLQWFIFKVNHTKKMHKQFEWSLFKMHFRPCTCTYFLTRPFFILSIFNEHCILFGQLMIHRYTVQIN